MKLLSNILLTIGLVFWAFMSCKKDNSLDSNFELDNTEFIKFDLNNKVYDLKYKHKSGGYEMTNSLDGLKMRCFSIGKAVMKRPFLERLWSLKTSIPIL